MLRVFVKWQKFTYDKENNNNINQNDRKDKNENQKWKKYKRHNGKQIKFYSLLLLIIIYKTYYLI